MIVTVCALGCTYASLATAAQRVPSNATIVVRGSVRGDVIFARSMTVRGEGDARISGGQSGITVRAPRVKIEGLRFAGYGLDDPSGRHAAIVLTAPDDIVRGNAFDGNAFAISLARADRAVIANNRMDGLESLQPAVAGDSLRLWYSADVTVRGNTFADGRDILISYSPGLLFADNVVRTSRYGLHDMFSDDLRVERNVFENNEIGANFMYAKGLHITGNTFRANHGAAGYGIGLEDVDASHVRANRFEGNRVGLNSVDSPSIPVHRDDIQSNLFTHNGSALSLQSDPHALRVVGNAFSDNIEDVAVSGGGAAAGVVWTTAGRGNYWNAYPGYDRNGDGIGDIAYAPQPAFDSLTDSHPELQMFRYSPAALAVEFAARALPAAVGAPEFTDSAPLMAPPSGVPMQSAQRTPNPLAGLLALLAVIPLATLRRSGRVAIRSQATARGSQSSAALAIKAQNVRKIYAGERGVRDISLAVRRGESVALWGANGAGKTTLLRCILGEKLNGGILRVFGHIPSPHDRAARTLIGYAPQHLPDFDARVGEIAEMVAALRDAAPSEAARVLNLVQLSDEHSRFVGELSGGMRQRLSVALALIGDPPLLLLDEPTAGLDRQSRETVVALLQQERARGKTLLFTSHMLEDIRALADTVVTLESGSVVESASAKTFAAPYLRNIS